MPCFSTVLVQAAAKDEKDFEALVLRLHEIEVVEAYLIFRVDQGHMQAHLI